MKRIISIDPLLINFKSSSSLHPGRKIKKDSYIRRFFCASKKSKKIPPKKEYLRCKLIRGFKRAIRQINKNVLPSKTLNRMKGNPYNALGVWQALAGCYEKYMEVLDPLSCTENSHKANKNNKEKINSKYLVRSFNSSLCKDFFFPIEVREAFYYYIEFLFADLNPESLCDKFDLMCCSGAHTNGCIEKWLMIKKYMNCYMIQDLEIEPWFPSTNSNSFLPSIFTVRIDNPTKAEIENQENVSKISSNYNIIGKILSRRNFNSSIKFKFNKLC
ncbi:unnamed protein product [Blepharisma stoltei]|uniref:Uncharacterized protein n=1 Tax=Blepharisma stoltei TaxID=1481888 RepID=A0AAU9K500_9CILI|nr:unnamed protein product [Blepharisma stoltei]